MMSKHSASMVGFFVFCLLILGSTNLVDGKNKSDEKKLSDLRCSQDQIAKFDGTNWVCEPLPVDTDTNTNAATDCAAGEYLDGDGTCKAVPVDTNTNSATECAVGEVLVADGGAGVCVPFLINPSFRIIFVTSQRYQGGVAGEGIGAADQACNAAAAAAGLSGFFVAWASTSGQNAKDRLATTDVPYIRTDGGKVANNLADLIDGNLLLPINIDEHGIQVLDFFDVWTGTDEFGETDASARHCGDWADPAYALGGLTGCADSTAFLWARGCGASSCDFINRWYCVQQ